jgi:hypothetical protein
MQCPICKRSSDNVKDFEFHHFEPISSRRKTEDGIDVCGQCADQVHLLFGNTELRNHLNSLEKLVSHEKIIKYVAWVKNKPITAHYTTKEKKRKR